MNKVQKLIDRCVKDDMKKAAALNIGYRERRNSLRQELKDWNYLKVLDFKNFNKTLEI